MNDKIFSDRRQALEEDYFNKLEREKIEKFRAKELIQKESDKIRSISGITNDKLIHKMMEMGITSEIWSLMSLVPLVEVAWASGTVETAEREILLQVARENGLQQDTAAYDMLSQWVREKPDHRWLSTWKEYIQEMVSSINGDEVGRLKSALLSTARKIAQADGGFLGLGSKIADNEKQVLRDLESLFSESK